MDPLAIAVVLVALVAVATGIGLLHRGLQGRARRARRAAGSDVVSFDGLTLGDRATLLQFSTEFCTTCGPTRRVLSRIAHAHPGTRHVDIDVTHRADLAARFNLLQTPTTLVLDARGTLHARIGGSVRPDRLTAELDRVLALTDSP